MELMSSFIQLPDFLWYNNEVSLTPMRRQYYGRILLKCIMIFILMQVKMLCDPNVPGLSFLKKIEVVMGTEAIMLMSILKLDQIMTSGKTKGRRYLLTSSTDTEMFEYFL